MSSKSITVSHFCIFCKAHTAHKIIIEKNGSRIMRCTICDHETPLERLIT